MKASYETGTLYITTSKDSKDLEATNLVVSSLCDKGYYLADTTEECDNKTMFTILHNEDKVYMSKLYKTVKETVLNTKQG